jgi:rhodanese-related sulfurtransferase/membrane-associated phospholipid phosphatase
MSRAAEPSRAATEARASEGVGAGPGVSRAGPPWAAGQSRAPSWQPAHRLIAYWLLATAPLLAVPLLVMPLQPALPRALLLAAHVVVAVLLLRQPLGTPRLPGSPLLWTRVRDWLPLLVVPLFYWEVPLLAQPIHGGAVYDAVVMGWEAAIFGGQPSQTFAARWPWLWISEPLHAAYLSYYFIGLVPPVVLYLMGRHGAFRRVVFTLAVAVLAHQAAFVAFPVLGPRYLFPAPAGPLEAGPLYQLTHWVLEGGSSPGTAFPSSHVGISVAMTVALFRERLAAAPWLAVLTTLLAVGTVYGGFHYAVDAIAGLALGLAAALAAPVIHDRMRRTGRPGGTSSSGRGLQPEKPTRSPSPGGFVKRILVIAMVAGLGACSDGQREQGPALAAATDGARAPVDATQGTHHDVARGGPEAAAPDTITEPERRVVYVDVRTPGEWAQGRVQGAIHIPYTELAQRIDELESYRDADIVLYCRTGRRSGIAEQIMTQAGFQRLHNGGGLTDLARQGVPVER